MFLHPLAVNTLSHVFLSTRSLRLATSFFFFSEGKYALSVFEVDFMTGKEALFHKDPHFVPRVFYDIMDGCEQRENNFNSLLLCKERMILFLGYRGFLFSKLRIYIVKTVSLYLPLLAGNIC